MRALWRRRSVAATDAEWHRVVNRELPYEMAAEMATWPDPIDVIRDALGLPWRWERRAAAAWAQLLEVAAGAFANTASDAEAARMARLMLLSASFNNPALDLRYRPRKHRRA